MNLLAIDPGSRTTGWAFMVEGRVVQAARLRLSSKLHPAERIDAAANLIDMLASKLASSEGSFDVVIEIPSGKVHGRPGGFQGAGLSVYGMAVGAIREALRRNPGVAQIHSVCETRWTGGHSKAKRARVAMNEFPELALRKDAGHDISDAIALAVWYRDVGTADESIYSIGRKTKGGSE